MIKSRYNKLLEVLIYTVIIILVIITVINLVVFNYSISDSDNNEKKVYHSYKYHFGMVYSNSSGNKWKEIYNAANEYAMQNDAYVEIIGENIKQNYSKEDLFRIAMLSGVDGIIVEGDEKSDELNILINEAYESDIPVVTVMTDASESKRSSFVGLGSYDVGKQLGGQMINLSKKNDETHVMVLMNSTNGYQEQHTMYQAIAESISAKDNILVDTWLVSNDNEFGVDEEVRDIILNLREEPDIMICLSDNITESAYQQVVEYNKVSSIDIIGLASSEIVYDAINKNLIDGVVSFDKKMMGNNIVDALLEYKNNGYVNEYYMVDTNLVTKSNVGRYLNNEE